MIKNKGKLRERNVQMSLQRGLREFSVSVYRHLTTPLVFNKQIKPVHGVTKGKKLGRYEKSSKYIKGTVSHGILYKC